MILSEATDSLILIKPGDRVTTSYGQPEVYIYVGKDPTDKQYAVVKQEETNEFYSFLWSNLLTVTPLEVKAERFYEDNKGRHWHTYES